jgi:Ni,Fe-hydrogenase III large subunit
MPLLPDCQVQRYFAPGDTNVFTGPIKGATKNAFTIALNEGHRGEIAHVLVTDASGELVQAKIKDPSFHNWHGLALSVRENGISDFPLCNKSFDLSYAGHDL